MAASSTSTPSRRYTGRDNLGRTFPRLGVLVEEAVGSGG